MAFAATINWWSSYLPFDHIVEWPVAIGSWVATSNCSNSSIVNPSAVIAYSDSESAYLIGTIK